MATATWLLRAALRRRGDSEESAVVFVRAEAETTPRSTNEDTEGEEDEEVAEATEATEATEVAEAAEETEETEARSSSSTEDREDRSAEDALFASSAAARARLETMLRGAEAYAAPDEPQVLM